MRNPQVLEREGSGNQLSLGFVSLLGIHPENLRGIFIFFPLSEHPASDESLKATAMPSATA